MLKKIVKTVIYKMAYIIGFLFLKREDDNTEIFLRLDNIGDFLLWLPSMQDYCNCNPEKKIILICPQNDAILAEKYLNLNRIIICNKDDVYLISKSVKIFFRTLFILCTLQCNRLIVPVYSRTVEINIAAYLIKSKTKIAIDGDNTGMDSSHNKKCNKIYHLLIPTQNDTIHEIERNVEFMTKIGKHVIHARIANLKEQRERKIKEKYFVISPGGSIRIKCWEVNKFVELANLLQKKYGYTCVLCGDKNDQDLATCFLENKNLKVINLISQTSIEELISIIQHAEFFVGNDSVGIHMAATVKTQAFCLFPGAYYGRFLPYTVENSIHVIEYRMPCLGCSLGISGQECLTIECKKNLMRNGCYLCLTKMKSETVYHIIENVEKGK